MFFNFSLISKPNHLETIHECSCQSFLSATLPVSWKGKGHTQGPLLSPWVALISCVVHVWLCVCGEDGGHIITHSAADRAECRRPAGARGFVFHPFFRGPAVVWVRRAQWCCCYKYASTSVSKWQLYSGPRTHCLGTVKASHSKKGKPSVAALVDMYLCTWGSWCVAFTSKLWIGITRSDVASWSRRSRLTDIFLFALWEKIWGKFYLFSVIMWFVFFWKSKEWLLRN